jgi:heptosyltransferase-1
MIVVVHPAAIGDAVMGTTVAQALKKKFPEAKIVYLTHPSLFPLLELSRSIDVFVEWNRQTPLKKLVQEVREYKPELIIDLVGSIRTRLFGLFSGARVLTFRKQKNRRTWNHVVENYLATLAPLDLQMGERLCPSLTAPPEFLREWDQDENLGRGQDYIALVPGVGKHRPNRAWPVDNWAQLGKLLLQGRVAKLALVGGEDDKDTCHAVAEQIGDHCLNMAGKMSLVQTAALLTRAKLVISADTGPAHIAAAVGKPVICLMGPTDAQRTGPYRMDQLGISVAEKCKCAGAKRCLLNDGKAAGECMKTIGVDDVMERVRQLLAVSTTGGA